MEIEEDGLMVLLSVLEVEVEVKSTCWEWTKASWQANEALGGEMQQPRSSSIQVWVWLRGNLTKSRWLG